MEPGDRSPSKLLENYLGHLAYGRQLFPSSATVESPSNSMTATSVPASATTTAAAHPPGLGRLTLQEQQQEQQASNRRASNSTQLPQSAEPVAASHSSNETENENFRQNSFLLNLYVALQEASFPKALGWSDDGKAFYANQEDPTFLTLLRKNFKPLENKAIHWNRQLVLNGFKKVQQGENAGMMFNKYFHRDMGADDFETIIRSRKDMEVKEPTAARTNKTNAAASKTNRETAVKTTSKVKKKSKITKATKATKGTKEKKAASGGKGTSSTSNKKRKKPSDSSEAVEKQRSKKKKLSTGPDKKGKGVDHAIIKRLTSYRNLINNYFGKWDMWNYPSGLQALLEERKFMKSNRKFALNTAYDTEAELQYDHSDENVKTLLCDEELPDSVMDEREEKQTQADFVDRIRNNNLHQEKLKELWSEAVAPEVKGKVLPQSKFAKPTDRWEKLKVGDRVAIYWRDDGTFYNATIQKQQLKTSYFHLMYEDDGVSEWLDMSREFFKVLNEANKQNSSATSTPQRPSRHRVAHVSDATPRRDNRARSIQESREESNPMNLPDSHVHLKPYVRPSWNGLGLGIRAGTPAYNSFVKERDASAPKATAVDILNDLRDIRLRGFSGIPLHFDDEIASNEIGNVIDDAKALDSNQILTNQLRNLHDQIAKDNDVASSTKYFDQTLDIVREVTEKWTIPTVKKNLRALETQFLKLNERESRILGKYKEKGLL